jgi:uncharacterized RDD family membrane protein YckC
MKYVIRTPDGKEYGPVDQQVLAQWVESGRVTADCEVRNLMMKTWSGPDKFPFLEEVLRRRGAKPAPAAAAATVAEEEEAEVREPREAVYSLMQTGAFKFVPASPLQRLVAWAMDLLLLGGVGAVMFLAIHGYLSVLPAAGAVEAKPLLFMRGTVLWVLLVVAYYVVGFGLKAQTVGQWFWGIMVIRTAGEPVLAFRAMFYFLLHVLLLPTTVLCVVLPGRRGLQEFIAGVRVVKITVRDRK